MNGRFLDELERLLGRPYIVGTRLNGNHQHVGGQHDALGHGILTRRTVNHCVVVPIGNDADILVNRRLGVPNDREKCLALSGCAPIQSGGLRSQSIRMTLLPWTTNSPATFVARVVFPTPPFWLRKAIAITEIQKNGNLHFCKSFFADYQSLRLRLLWRPWGAATRGAAMIHPRRALKRVSLVIFTGSVARKPILDQSRHLLSFQGNV
jgi:hypothetical protein